MPFYTCQLFYYFIFIIVIKLINIYNREKILKNIIIEIAKIKLIKINNYYS